MFSYITVSDTTSKKEMSKVSSLQTDDKPNKLGDYFTLLNKHENLNNLKMEGKYIIQKTQPRKKSKVINSKRCKRSKHTHKHTHTHTLDTFTMTRLGGIKKLDRLSHY